MTSLIQLRGDEGFLRGVDAEVLTFGGMSMNFEQVLLVPVDLLEQLVALGVDGVVLLA